MSVVEIKPTDSSENGKPVARRGHKAYGSQGDGRAAGEHGGRKMKKALIGLLAVALVAGMSSLVFAEGSGTGIVGSPHDFSSATWNQRSGELCRTCHVPHDHGRTLAVQTGIESSGLLWNHKLSDVVYTLYSSATLNGAIGQPTGTAKMCLGCHDGSVALEAMDSKAAGGHSTTTYIQTNDAGFQVPGTGMGGTSLQGTHPISVVYDSAADPGLKATTNSIGTSGTIASLLDGGKVQCSTCHDVHDSLGEAVGGTHLLRVSNTATPSGLCLACHIK